MKILSTLCILLLCLSFTVLATTKYNGLLCNKKWYGVKYIDTNGKPHDISRKQANDYMVYAANGNFVAKRELRMPVYGKWSFNDTTKELTVTQTTEPSSPATSVWTIANIDETHLVLKIKNASGKELTFYYEAKK